MAKVVHFEIQADDVERARAFYESALGWSFEDWTNVTGSPYWGIRTGPETEMGIDDGLLPRPAPTDGPGRGTAWQGYFIDTEGNTFGVHQPDPSAA
jgi:uncharacterized protein